MMRDLDYGRRQDKIETFPKQKRKLEFSPALLEGDTIAIDEKEIGNTPPQVRVQVCSYRIPIGYSRRSVGDEEDEDGFDVGQRTLQASRNLPKQS